jgi:uncharacterized integral membrane protein (TIGR00698 family)
MLKQLTQYFGANIPLQKIIYISLAIICLTPLISASLALILGFILAQLIGNPFTKTTQQLTHTLLQISVVGLGFGMNVDHALKAGKEGFLFTIVSIISVFLLGYLLTKIFKIEKVIGYLISAGTAICGGSAIAAISPIIHAKASQISVALAVVFVLNSLALLLFPSIGHWLHLSQQQFGLWCAIAIHDTSSVVGAASKYGTEALEVATTVKLTRALWIILFSFISMFLFKSKNTKIKIPYFIGYFVVAICLHTYFPIVQQISPYIVSISKSGLTLTLFLIGSGLTYQVVKNVGIRPLLMAAILWVFISCASLLIIIN